MFVSLYQRLFPLFLLLSIMSCQAQEKKTQVPTAETPPSAHLSIPYISHPVNIDGDLSEWRSKAFCEGWWDLDRLRYASWYNPKRNRLTDHGEENVPSDDLRARYYIAWSDSFLYLGAQVIDNVNDVTESRHAPKRWYYKDAIAFFIEAPLDTVRESFGAGNHGFAFVIDSTRPDYGAWWRHGNLDTTYLEEPLPDHAVAYAISFDGANYVLEARISLFETLAKGDSAWHAPQIGDRYRLMIVHCDPDGGEYGGHLLIYGKVDPDDSWTEARLTGELVPFVRKVE